MEAEFKKAVNLFEIDKIKQAKKICIKIYKKNPKHFDNLRLLNFIYFKEKNFYEALNIINEAIKINPNFAEAYSEQGNALNELKQLNMALKSYDNAIKINPNFSNAYKDSCLMLLFLFEGSETVDKSISILSFKSIIILCADFNPIPLTLFNEFTSSLLITCFNSLGFK